MTETEPGVKGNTAQGGDKVRMRECVRGRESRGESASEGAAVGEKLSSPHPGGDLVPEMGGERDRSCHDAVAHVQRWRGSSYARARYM